MANSTFSFIKNTLFINFFILGMIFTNLSSAQDRHWGELIKDPKVKINEVKESFDQEWKDKEYQKGKGIKQFNRWFNFWENRLLPNGEFPVFAKGFNEYVSFQNSFPLTANNNEEIQWTAVGPVDYQYTQSWSPGQGRVNCIEEDPNNNQIIYVGTPAGGLWKTIDGGINWQPISDFLSVIGISSIAINPSNNLEIYIATGDADGGDTYSIGIWKSENGGEDWYQTSFPSFQANKIIIDSQNNNIIWAASNSGLYKSENSGQDWQLYYNGNIRDLALAPGNNEIIYFSTNNEVYYSFDGGQNFSQSNGLTDNKSRIAITVSESDPSLVYILTAAPDQSFAGVYKSENYGQDFVLQNNNTDIFDGSTQAYYDMAITVSQTDPNFLVAGVLNLWKSYNGGLDWTPVNSWSNPSQESYTHADIHFLKYFNNTLYCGSDGGIYKSTNDALSFNDLSQKLQIGQFYKISTNQINPFIVSGGLQDNGGFYYNGQNWIVWHGADGMESVISPYNSSEVYGMIQFGGLYSSTDGQTINSLGSPEEGRWITPMQFDSLNNKIIAGYSQLYSYSQVNGWQTLSNFSFPSLISQIEIYQSNSDTIFLSEGSNLYMSNDGGSSIVPLNSPTTSTISSIEVNKYNPNELWVVQSGWTNNQKVFHTTDLGLNWENISYNLPNLPANVIKRDHSNNDLYLGMDIGIYHYNTETNLWTSFSNNLPNVIVNDIEISESFDLVTIGTYGRGVWQSDTYNAELDSIRIYAFQIDSLDEFVCSSSINPTLSYINVGYNDITSLNINYSIDENNYSYLWEGVASYGENFYIELPAIQNLSSGNHTLLVEIDEVNGQEYISASENLEFDFYTSTGQEDVTFYLTTDCYASETSFSLFDETGSLVYFQNNSLADYSFNQYDWCLQPQCYSLVVYDSYGDGMEGTEFSCDTDGSFTLINQNNDLVFEMESPNFGFEVTHNFCVEESVFGCLDPNAYNYNSLANVSDGSCTYDNYQFCDDFESYPNNSPIAESSNYWESWATSYNNLLSPPYIDDTQVTTGTSVSGSNALYFPLSNNGGPQDIVLPFTEQATFSNGYFELSFNILATNGAYFNFQENHLPGVWLLNAYIEQNQLSFADGSDNVYFQVSLNQSEWNALKFKFNLINGTLEFYLNDNLILNEELNIFQIGALNLYPLQSHEFWIDDICYIADSYPFGCTEPSALNYDPDANLADNSSCCYTNSSTDIQNHCDQYTWIDGNTYTESNNTAMYTLTSSNNCDSIVTLDLTINYSNLINESMTACGSYQWNGVTYNQSGNFTYLSTNTSGCIETNILSLLINESSTAIDTQNHCDQYTWIDGNTYAESNNTATYNLTNANGCDSIVTLDLTINYSNLINESMTACGSYQWNGVTYNQSGNFTFLNTNTSGCIETNILTLIINEISSSNDSVIVCDEYEWNDQVYTESGNFTFESLNSDNCDSIANLNLTVSNLEELLIEGESVANIETTDNLYSISNPNANSTYFWSLSNNVGTIDVGNANNFEITISWGENDSETNLCVFEEDEFGCQGEESCITIDVKKPSSIEDFEQEGLLVYPNPFKNQTTVSFYNPNQSKATLKLIDSRGRTVRNYDGIIGNSIIIKKEDLSEGLYYIQLNLNNQISRNPIAIQ